MKIPIFPGKNHQNGGFSMAMLVYRSAMFTFPEVVLLNVQENCSDQLPREPFAMANAALAASLAMPMAEWEVLEVALCRWWKKSCISCHGQSHIFAGVSCILYTYIHSHNLSKYIFIYVYTHIGLSLCGISSINSITEESHALHFQ